jgi:5-methylcytosine-specific restriction endonuclease McrA
MLCNLNALVLNADFRPVSLFPLSTRDVERTIKNVFEGVVSVVAEYDVLVRSPSVTMRLPSVIALRKFVPPAFTGVVFEAETVFLRDRHRCQYCGERRPLTIDHVHPTSKGGLHCWTNVVACCDPCNNRKGDTVGLMHPMKVPREPTPAELHALARALRKQAVHPTWVDYLPAEAA